MKEVLICFEIPCQQGLMTGHSIEEVTALTKSEVQRIAQQLYERHATAMKLRGLNPAGQLVIRSLTRLEEELKIEH